MEMTIQLKKRNMIDVSRAMRNQRQDFTEDRPHPARNPTAKKFQTS